ncbi:CBS domain-containing protein [Fulvivirga lutimaris]|uniref:CBS domain-containing protein n=1 Tax=Fulvivirga lutimaris TaxID=1819566 RepID=UPI0012BC29D1|nr:CBS domain-containing protein [Fulvivirga lutimaris]MTI40231.1 CBS domain-containing protein [Fulvivirga lutimaris]
MGEHRISIVQKKEERVKFIKYLLNDISALELMLKNNRIENNVYRIGAEQEFCLITPNWRPAKNGEVLLEKIDDPHFTTELARYNLELNLDPHLLENNCFSKVENQIRDLLKKAEKVATKNNTKIILTGILPTISKNELGLDFMTPNPRYWALNEMTKAMRGDDFDLNIRGVDQLSIRHDSVLFEACNTSFQIHLQVPPADFVASYNWAQAISGPVLGICANSPLLLGRELWSETRIALFQQSIDTRTSSYALKDQQSRVSFGLQWAKGSIAEIYKNDIVRHKALFTKDDIEDSMEVLTKGGIPKLSALNLHNGTIYRWNRPCYGAHNGVAHVRIENRYIPSGPSVADEMANFAFWVGLMIGRPPAYDDMEQVMDFKDAKANFVKAARSGKESILIWKGKAVSVKKLVINDLLPIAYAGLKKAGILDKDINRYLEIIEKRTKGQTGSEWMIRNYRRLRKGMNQDDALISLTKSIHKNQHTSKPVHEWPQLQPKPRIHETAHLVSHIMSTQLFVVNEDDLAALATSIMLWKNVHHVPVENEKGQLTGLLTWTHMKRFKEKGSDDQGQTVAEIMTKKVLTVEPYTEIKDAIALMKKNEYGCLPVVHGQHLVGIITIKDLTGLDHG